MFTAYFDESGTHAGSPAVVVGGYVSTDTRWNKFQVKWRKILDDAGLEFFHMSEFESSQGPYKTWSKDKRIQVIKQIIGAIKKRTEVGVSTAIVKADFDEVASTLGFRFSAYTFCVYKALLHVEMWANKYEHHEPIAYVFEQGAGYAGELDELKYWIEANDELKRRLRWKSFTTADKRLLNPLQAADIHAYETYKEMDNCIVPGEELRGLRKSMIQLIRGEVYCGTFYTKKDHNFGSLPFK